jgi:predicted RNase H-like nuclease (RuvC/YqgF family)
MRLSEFYKIYVGTFVVGLAAEEIYSYVRDMRSRTVNVTVITVTVHCKLTTRRLLGSL